jgi:putative FmdB family regulatory protein
MSSASWRSHRLIEDDPMPTYQYVCTDIECGNQFELVQSFTDAAVSECPVCQHSVRKVYGSVGVVFKGSGFYRNDSRKAAGLSESHSDSSSGSSKSDTKSDSTSRSESKPDSKSDSSGAKSEPQSDSKSASKSGAASKRAKSTSSAAASA